MSIIEMTLNLSSPIEDGEPFAKESYYIFITALFLLLAILSSISYYYKQKNTNKEEETHTDKLPSSDLVKRTQSLKYRYLICYLLTKANIWAKTAYLYTIYNKYQKFNVKEIGILYLIDNLSALFFAPITGNLADVFGRKLFCLLYCIFVIINLCLRLTGVRDLAYLAQVLTGISAALITTTFESWLNFEATKEFKTNDHEKEKFLKKIFKTQMMIDAMNSVITSIIAAVVYNLFGLLAPIYLSMGFAAAGFISILILWDENRPSHQNSGGFNAPFKKAFKELKKRDVFSIGLVESMSSGVLAIFLFSWTPILQLSSPTKDFNVGLVSICFVTMIINGTVIYEILHLHLNFNLYSGLVSILMLECGFFFIVFQFDSFVIRMLFLSLINVLYISI